MAGQIDFASMARALVMHPQMVGDVTKFPGKWNGTHYPMGIEDRGGIQVYVPIMPQQAPAPLTDQEKYMKALIEQQMKGK